ncbi:hypothetical protein LNV23_01600 [Paucibacter sp. DJ1R-11]|uniref:hypothetical protein n=1 Tax=Paucibacter sp. DJ1R-11 TaxID=2893556 RepID=UPI0021E430BD|nr:hypothetical protein [Paucibacter sp. DJ1R-11]MCV2362140.1 hypothetical protein [Paucibacter sp. DJ1R-11]
MTATRWGMAVALLATGLFAWWQWDEAATEQQRLAAEQAKEKADLAAAQAGQPAYGLRDLFTAVDQPLPRGPAASAATSSSNPWQLAQASTAMAETGGSEAPELSPEDRALNEQLRRLGYQIDERYYRMPLGQLRQAAAAKDVQALTHLAERYLFALDGKPQEAEHEPGFPYREAARSALTEAYLRGNRHAAAMISETFLLEKKPLDAAAWNLIARRAGDELSADWFLKTQDYLQLGDAGRQQAAEKAEALWAQLESRKKNGA